MIDQPVQMQEKGSANTDHVNIIFSTLPPSVFFIPIVPPVYKTKTLDSRICFELLASMIAAKFKSYSLLSVLYYTWRVVLSRCHVVTRPLCITDVPMSVSVPSAARLLSCVQIFRISDA